MRLPVSDRGDIPLPSATDGFSVFRGGDPYEVYRMRQYELFVRQGWEVQLREELLLRQG